jgi:hypothetical protein
MLIMRTTESSDIPTTTFQVMFSLVVGDGTLTNNPGKPDLNTGLPP